jgi:hypothetical protein
VKVKISVKQEDIDKGLLRDAYHCPIARAGKRAGIELGVNSFHLLVSKMLVYGTQTIQTPREIKEFVDAFDHFGPGAVRPFEFELEIEDKFLPDPPPEEDHHCENPNCCGEFGGEA